MRSIKHELLSEEQIDPAVEKHMTLPTRVSLVPKCDSFGYPGQCGMYRLDEEEEDCDDGEGDFDRLDDDVNDLSVLNDHVHVKCQASTAVPQNTMYHTGMRHTLPSPEEAKETESYGDYQDESVASQQREIFDLHHDASSVQSILSVPTATSCDITRLKASDTIVEQQIAILRKIQEENDREPEHGTDFETIRQASGSYKRQRSGAYSFQTSQRTTPTQEYGYGSLLQDQNSSFLETETLPPPPLLQSATANLAMYLEGRQVQSISKARVEEASKNGTSIRVGCVGCGKELMAAKDMAMVYCSSCGTLAPLDLAVIAARS